MDYDAQGCRPGLLKRSTRLGLFWRVRRPITTDAPWATKPVLPGGVLPSSHLLARLHNEVRYAAARHRPRHLVAVRIVQPGGAAQRHLQRARRCAADRERVHRHGQYGEFLAQLRSGHRHDSNRGEKHRARLHRRHVWQSGAGPDGDAQFRWDGLQVRCELLWR